MYPLCDLTTFLLSTYFCQNLCSHDLAFFILVEQFDHQCRIAQTYQCSLDIFPFLCLGVRLHFSCQIHDKQTTFTVTDTGQCRKDSVLEIIIGINKMDFKDIPDETLVFFGQYCDSIDGHDFQQCLGNGERDILICILQ